MQRTMNPQHARSGMQFPKAFSRTASLIHAFDRTQPKIRAVEGFMRFELNLQNSGSYQMNMNQAQGGLQLVTETRIRQSDVFLPTLLGCFIKKAGSSTTPTDSDQAVAQLLTFPNSQIFTGTNEAANLESIYNAKLQFQVNNTILIDGIDVLRYRRVGQAQQGVQLSQQASAVGSNGAYLRNQWDNEHYGMMPMHQTIALNGQATQNLNLILPSAVNNAGTNSQNYFVVIMRGVLLLNASGVVNDSTLETFMKK